MKIIQVNTVCGRGSVGRIVVDLYKTIQKAGDIPVAAYGRGDAPADVNGFLIGNKADFYMHVLRNFFLGESGFGSKGVTDRFVAWLKEQKPDVIHLHNIHGFYLQTERLFAYLKEAHIPVVWTFHDCWPFTGHCAYFDHVSCDKWKTGCHDCIQHARAYPYALFCDNSKQSFLRKKEAFCGVEDLRIVTPSRWLAGLVRQSFLQEYPVQVIPNGIDLDQFRPTEFAKERGLPGQTDIDQAAKLLLGVANVWEQRKGLSCFKELAKRLPDGWRILLVGVNEKQQRELKKEFPSRSIIGIGRTENVKELAALYTRADVYVNLTLEDNFPTTNLEALACGTPVITFDTGGSRESLNDACGYVVPKGDLDAVLEALESSLQKPKPVQACLKRAEDFDKKKCFKAYLTLYRHLTDNYV
ncbi:MAG: glycosyltransferase [Lachnospiraceae bacterium]|jgi:glycosyltransferase involved in cell wall biosynthesis|nr:glycosyltransferase [Lachnospiraceae bacterium]